MASRVHGVFSLALTGIAVAVAVVVLFGVAPGLGAAYLALCAVGMGGIVCAFCAKCPCKVRCGHVLPGLIARLFPRKPGPYTPWENGVTIVSLLLILGFPLPWLWQNLAALLAFVLLSGVAVTDILTFVCKTCDNVNCPLMLRRSA